MEMVPWCLLHAGKVCRGETRQLETAVEERQVLGAGVTVLMTVGKNVLGSREIEDGKKNRQPKGAQLKKPWYVEQRMLMKSKESAW